MTATLTRSMTGMQVREVQVREVSAETREIVGIAVPWNETVSLGWIRERFERGALEAAGEVPLFSGHDHRAGGLPIGRVTSVEDTADGLLVRAVISATPKGDEVYQLLRDGVLDKFSVGFEPVDHRVEDEDVVVHTRARLIEVSVVTFPAYDGAQITEVRDRAPRTESESGEDVVETTDSMTDVAELRDTVTDLQRKLALISEQGSGMQAAQASQFRSGGEILKALARGDEAAKAEFRAADATGPATSAQAGANFGDAGWMNRPLKFVQEKRRVVNLFSRAPLPSAGNTVEYPKVASSSGSVAKQVTEGTALAYMEVELGTGSAVVGTYGGYSSLTRQTIERSDMAYLDAVLRYQAIQYAKSTEAASRTDFLAMAAGATLTFPKLSLAKAKDWIDMIVDASAAVEDNSLGLEAEFVYVSRDVFKALAHLTDTSDRPIFALKEGAVNVVGAANLTKASANIAGLPVVVDPKAGIGTVRVASSEAFTTLESGGAPFRLQDESVVNLTRDFSLYGYLATTANDQGGLVKVTVTPEV